MFLLIEKSISMPPRSGNFNTSHVSINLISIQLAGIILFISIHLMFLLITTCSGSVKRGVLISIHLMFLLIELKSNENYKQLISIHLMFLLIDFIYFLSRFIQYFNTSHVSINRKRKELYMVGILFQYISCFY